MPSFIVALAKAKIALSEAGYPRAELAILLSESDVYSVQREVGVAAAMVDQALRPEPSALGLRLLAVVHGVRVYVGGGEAA